jgi:hypothetical protein
MCAPALLANTILSSQCFTGTNALAYYVSLSMTKRTNSKFGYAQPYLQTLNKPVKLRKDNRSGLFAQCITNKEEV